MGYRCYCLGTVFTVSQRRASSRNGAAADLGAMVRFVTTLTILACLVFATVVASGTALVFAARAVWMIVSNGDRRTVFQCVWLMLLLIAVCILLVCIGVALRGAVAVAYRISWRLNMWSQRDVAERLGQISEAVCCWWCVDRYFVPMAQRVFGEAAIPQEDQLAMELARWIVRTRPRQFNARETRRTISRASGDEASDARCSSPALGLVQRIGVAVTLMRLAFGELYEFALGARCRAGRGF